MLGHFAWDFPHARDCPKHWPDGPKEADAGMQRSAPLNMFSAQEVTQEHHTLIAAIQNQVSLQQQLLAAQATFARQDEMRERTQGLAIWGRADIVQASLTDPAGQPRAGVGEHSESMFIL